MNTEIKTQFDALVTALTASDEEGTGLAVIALASVFFQNVDRITDAVEQIAANYGGVDPFGESTFDPTMFGGEPNTNVGMLLSDEETNTILALRSGDAVVMPSGKSRAEPTFTPTPVDPELARIAALPVPRAPAPNAIAWTGGPFAPVAGPVFTQRRDGTMTKEPDATALDWNWHGDGDDICHYAAG